MLLLASPVCRIQRRVQAAHLSNPPMQVFRQPLLHRLMVVQVWINARSRQSIVEAVCDVNAARHLFIGLGLAQTIGAKIRGTLERSEDSHTIRAINPLVWLFRGIPKEEEDTKVPSDEVFPHSEKYQPLSAELPVLCNSVVRNSLGLVRDTEELDLLMISLGGRKESGTLGLSTNDGKSLNGPGPYNFDTSRNT